MSALLHKLDAACVCGQHVSRDATNQWETTHGAAMRFLQMNLKQTHGCMNY